MKLVHFADLHLGYRAYHRTNQQGINIREADVARAFREALDRTVELAPELLLIAGDVFHTVRPSNAAIADAFRQLSRFHEESPETSVVVIAGNHDSPRAAETGNILRLFAEIPGITVVYQEPKRLAFPQFDAAVLCLPHNALISSDKPAIEPDPHVSVNILLAHGAHERLQAFLRDVELFAVPIEQCPERFAGTMALGIGIARVLGQRTHGVIIRDAKSEGSEQGKWPGTVTSRPTMPATGGQAIRSSDLGPLNDRILPLLRSNCRIAPALVGLQGAWVYAT